MLRRFRLNIDFQALLPLGWSSFFEPYLAELPRPDLAVARVIEEHKGSYVLLEGGGQYRAKVGGALHHRAERRGALPAVGDWVATLTAGSTPSEVSSAHPGENHALIEYVFPRRSKFTRKVAGRQQQEQIIAANLDVVFVVGALNREFNLRRLERYLVLVWESGARPVLLLNKADLCDDREAVLAEAAAVAPGVDVHLLSARLGEGVDQVRRHLGRGRTAAFVGSSGVGKSTLTNALLGHERLAVSAVREGDDRGRHTTTSRRMLFLPDGSMVIDTPGMRELQLWEAGSGVERAFDDVGSFADECRFRDCTHNGEPGCRVRTALQDGELDEERLENYRKLQAELDFQRRKQDPRLLHEQKEKWKKLCQAARESSRRKR